jgi:methionyl-tRNA synthetase
MSQDNLVYITTPIYYVNDRPHIGHAYTTIAADVLARYYRSQDKDVFFLTGTDEHGAKIAAAAAKAGQSPQEFVDNLVPIFQNTWQKLGINDDQFIRTTNPQHEQLVQRIVQKLVSNGFVEKREYQGLYCVGCERFLKPEELQGGNCPDHGQPPVKHSEENFFFLLSKFSQQLRDKIESGELEIEPVARRNEVLGKIDQGLEDVSISRAGVEWGIPFPGDDSQTIYVWVDALLNYYTATHIFETARWEQHPTDIHLMAKDILWFHAIVWPAMLLALDLPLPKKIFAHGFFTIDGKKMSKTVGNVLDPNALVDKFGADAVRYALLREFPFGEDGDISEAKIASRYEKDLANGLGNLLQRVLVMIKKYDCHFDRSNTPDCHLEPFDKLRVNSVERSLAPQKDIESLRFDNALRLIWDSLRKSNENIDKEKPWELAKTDKEKLTKILRAEHSRLVTIAHFLEPFMPETAKKMQEQLASLEPTPLFPRL